MANPGSFFEPRDIFFWTSGAFFDLCRRDAHTRQDEKQIANQKRGKLGNKSQARENKGQSYTQETTKIKKFFTHNKEKATRKALQGVESDENKLKGATRKGPQHSVSNYISFVEKNILLFLKSRRPTPVV